MFALKSGPACDAHSLVLGTAMPLLSVEGVWDRRNACHFPVLQSE